MTSIRPNDLGQMHPRLLWTEIAAALAIVVGESTIASIKRFTLAVQDVPGIESADLEWQFDLGGFSNELLAAMRRTYETARLVELAAIGIAGIGLHLAGGHEIRDVALRGSGADYLVDDENHLLEVAGRSRRADFQSAWRECCHRLSNRAKVGYYVCVSEFETLAGTLAFLNERGRQPMSTVQAPVSDMLVTVKSREVQRGLLADMRGEANAAKRHFLAAAHLEIVLSNEYAEAGDSDLSIRSRISAASCFWRGSQKEQAISIFDSLSQDFPDQTATFESELADLKVNSLA